MEVNHDGALLLVDLGRVDVQVQAVLVAHGGTPANIVLRADIAVVGRIELFGIGFDFDRSLKNT